MEDEGEILSDSNPSDSSDGCTTDLEDADYNDDNDDGDEEASAADSAPSDEDRKSKNVDALLRCGFKKILISSIK